MDPVLDLPYLKTDAGRAEIKARGLPLSRSARNLLLMLDTAHPARYWLEAIKGTSEDDLAYLISHGLIAASGGAMAAPVTAPAPAAAPASVPKPVPDGSGMGYDELYAYLSGNARRHLGLIKGYRLILDVERCTDLAALQELAWKMIAQIDQASGEAAADVARAEMRLGN